MNADEKIIIDIAQLTIARLIKERDEARREVCKKLHRYPEYIAECRGWDCYKESKTL